MLETPHSLLGGALGGLTGNPVAAAPLGIASHVAGDYFPHWNPHWPFRRRWYYVLATVDFLLALALVVFFWFAFPDRPEIAVGAFCGCLQDMILAAQILLKLDWLQWYYDVHTRMQFDVSLRAGWWPQTLVGLVSLYYLTRL